MANRWVYAPAGCVVMLGLAGQARAESQPSITVFVYNQAGATANTMARAKTEMARIYRDAGVEVVWMDDGAVEPTGHYTIRLFIRRRAVGRNQ